MMAPDRHRMEHAQLGRLRMAALTEGVTLLLLLLVAVPLKHLGGYPAATTWIGPIHGLAFLFYVWALFQTVASGAISRKNFASMIALAFIPTGSFLTERSLRTTQAALMVGSR